jgi:hypothetical protein
MMIRLFSIRPTLGLILVASLATSACGSEDDSDGFGGGGGPGDGGTDGGQDGDDGSGSEDSGDSGGDDGSTGADDTDSGAETSGDDGGDGSSPPNTDPGCVDGQYSETLPDPDADLTDLFDAFSPATNVQFLMGSLDRRYPIGAFIVRGASEIEGSDCAADWIDAGFGDPNDPSSILRNASLVVHECGHGLDLGMGFIDEHHYVITDELTITCDHVDTMPRGDIMGDEFSGDVPGDSYEDPYLTQLGDQGFDMLLEEATQYVNSLASGYSFQDQYTMGVSERDGILTFLWYLTRYLHKARNDVPTTYDALTQDPCWRTAILTIWGRAWLFVELTKDDGNLGINDAEILDAATDPVLLEEIERVRQAHGC